LRYDHEVSTAFIVGGTGQIGRAAALKLAESGWDVVAASRSGSLPDGLEAAGVRPLQLDRSVNAELGRAVRDGVDVLLDVIPFTRADAVQLNSLEGRLGSIVAISSASVYVDGDGRSFDEATSIDTFPRYPVPLAETQPTVSPGDATYSTQKTEMEQTLLAGPLPATIVRPGAVHGPGSEQPRELFFVKRILDGRPRVILVGDGESRFHTAAAANIAALVALAADRPGNRVLNCGDPEPPSVKEMCSTIARVLDAGLEPICVSETGYERRDLSNPWAVPFPLVLDMRAAERELGYVPAVTYEEGVRATCEWLVRDGAHQDWSHTYMGRFFDYEAEDAVLGGTSSPP
jgi:nucleoside-diphosphate-sugar epimerase